MSKVKKYLTAGATFATALAIGFVMQNGDVLAERFGSDKDEDTVQPRDATLGSLAPVVETPDLPPETVAVVVPTSFSEDPLAKIAPVQLTALGDDALLNETPGGKAAATADQPDTVADCAVGLDGTKGAAATVTLSLTAPCHPNARVTFHHQGLMFTAITDKTGQAVVTAPAMAADAVFIASFAEDDSAVFEIPVPELSDYHRAAVQWQGDAGFELHARVNDADYGSEGHIWSGAPGTASATGGFIISLGTDETETPLRVDIFTAPAALSDEVALTVEAEVSASNCGRDVTAQSLQLPAGGAMRAVDLELTMPNCATTGDFLVLNTMLEDLTLAAK